MDMRKMPASATRKNILIWDSFCHQKDISYNLNCYEIVIKIKCMHIQALAFHGNKRFRHCVVTMVLK